MKKVSEINNRKEVNQTYQEMGKRKRLYQVFNERRKVRNRIKH
jgi:hypothetical protein